MRELKLHPDCETGPVQAISAQIEPTESGCRARFLVEGDIAAIKVPVAAEAKREDYLWKATCFEIFWQPEGGTYYREFNLSPSSKWACYDFDDFRENSRDAPVEAIGIRCEQAPGSFGLSAEIASELPLPARVALNAIIEDQEGRLQFWAIDFAEGKPEFHSVTCRAIHLAGRL